MITNTYLSITQKIMHVNVTIIKPCYVIAGKQTRVNLSTVNFFLKNNIFKNNRLVLNQQKDMLSYRACTMYILMYYAKNYTKH